MYLWFLTKIWIWKPCLINYYIGCKRFPIEYNCCHGWCYDNSFDRRNFSAWPKNINCSLQCRVNKFCLKRRKKKSRKKKKISRKLLGCFESLRKWKYTQSRNAGSFNAGCYNRDYHANVVQPGKKGSKMDKQMCGKIWLLPKTNEIKHVKNDITGCNLISESNNSTKVTVKFENKFILVQRNVYRKAPEDHWQWNKMGMQYGKRIHIPQPQDQKILHPISLLWTTAVFP